MEQSQAAGDGYPRQGTRLAQHGCRKEFVVSDGDATAERITPEMVEAGARLLISFDTFFEDERSWAVRVYRAMREAAKKQPRLEG